MSTITTERPDATATTPEWRTVGSPLVTACDVRSDDDVARVFGEVGDAFGGQLDVLVHSVAFAAAED
ncbi:MAG TPA: SDR family oxidoreductase, partial [Polyangia bacterium]